MNRIKQMTAVEAMEHLTKTVHSISLQGAVQMVKKFKLFRSKMAKLQAVTPFYFPVFPECISYNKSAISNLLAQDGCCGIRIYPAINKKRQLTFVIVGLDEDGNNIYIGAREANDSKVVATTRLVDEGQMSPPYPASLI